MEYRHWQGYAILILITLIWGTTFTVTKSSLDHVPPLYFLAWRFSIASLGLLLLNLRALPALSRDELVGGIILGAAMATGFIAQTMGLVWSTAAKAGFITGLAVVLVPFVGAVFFGRRPPWVVYLAAAVAALGLALLSLDFSAGLSINQGDFFLLFCALAFAVYILYLGKYAPRCRILVLTMVQVLFTAVCCWVAALLFEEPVVFTGPVWGGLAYLALAATIFTTAAQTWGQRLVSPERAALVFTLEPVFAAAFAMILLGERLSPPGLLGGALIMAGIVGAEVLPGKVKVRKTE